MEPSATTTPTTTNEPDPTRKVWAFQIKEVVSRDFEVVAKNKSEALELLEEFHNDFTDHSYDFNCEDSHYVVHRIDGSHTWHRDMKPTFSHKYTQHLRVEDGGSGFDGGWKRWVKEESE